MFITTAGGGIIASGLLGGLLGGSKGGSSQSGTQTTTQQQQLDPRIASRVFGDNGQPGLLDRYQGLLDRPQNAGTAIYGQNADNYLGSNSAYDMGQTRNAAYGLMAGNTAAPQANAAMAGAAPQANAAQAGAAWVGNPQAYAVGNMVDAPAQNNMNLTGSYDRFINGDAGANPYLNAATQGAITQSGNQFDQMQSSATDNLRRNILPQIGSNAVLAGQYGGSRQGVAEGNAIGDFAKAQQQSITQFGQNNTNAAVGAQAQSFNQGQDRALAATQGLGAQQYGVASQNANTKNQAEFMNVANVNDNQRMQAGFNQQTGLANQNAQQTTNLSNQNALQQVNLSNQNAQQGTNLANLGAQQNTNQLNSNNTQTGLLGLTGLTNNAAGAAQNQDSYALNQAGKVNGLLTPYLSANSSNTLSQPLYQNTMGNVLGGTSAGLALGKQIGGLLGGGSSSGAGQGSAGGGPAGTYYDGYRWVPIGQ